MPNSVDAPTLLLCRGNHCLKKRKDAYNALREAIDAAHISFDTVACLGTCSGPTAMVCRHGEPRCFEQLRSPKTHSDLIEYSIRTGKKPSKRLRQRELTGKRHKRAMKKITSR